jgi:hypothetical protein
MQIVLFWPKLLPAWPFEILAEALKVPIIQFLL